MCPVPSSGPVSADVGSERPGDQNPRQLRTVPHVSCALPPRFARERCHTGSLTAGSSPPWGRWTLLHPTGTSGAPRALPERPLGSHAVTERFVPSSRLRAWTTTELLPSVPAASQRRPQTPPPAPLLLTAAQLTPVTTQELHALPGRRPPRCRCHRCPGPTLALCRPALHGRLRSPAGHTGRTLSPWPVRGSLRPDSLSLHAGPAPPDPNPNSAPLSLASGAPGVGAAARAPCPSHSWGHFLKAHARTGHTAWRTLATRIARSKATDDSRRPDPPAVQGEAAVLSLPLLASPCCPSRFWVS